MQLWQPAPILIVSITEFFYIINFSSKSTEIPEYLNMQKIPMLQPSCPCKY